MSVSPIQEPSPSGLKRKGPLRVAFLVGADSASTRASVEAVCRLEGVIATGILLDTWTPPGRSRIRNLWKNLRREGWRYAVHRLRAALRARLEGNLSAVVPRREVAALLQQAFPEQAQCLEDLARYHGCAVFPVGNLNRETAAECLRKTGAQLGIVVGTRVLKRSTFSIPELGCINLHKGEVPDYRGMPPGFWELYEGAERAGVTVHMVDDGLDTGDLIGEQRIPVHPKETVYSLRRKLDQAGAALLAECVARFRRGEEVRSKQPAGGGPARTKPTHRQQQQLAGRAPHLRQESDWARIFKAILYLVMFQGGVYGLVRRLRRSPEGRGAILLYHRVNDVSDDDALTTSPEIFAEHLAMLRRYYRVTTSRELVECIEQGRRVPPGTVAIHFDDCYRDFHEAGQLLKAAGLPATAFISSGFIGTERVFEHDRLRSPHRFQNLTREEVQMLPGCGFEIGAHTVNHVDLGSIDLQQAGHEVVDSRRELETILSQPVELFSFPYGRMRHIREEVRDAVKQSGYRAMFSAYGGFVSSGSDKFDIPRLGTNSRYRALDLMMELEGLSVAQLFRFAGRGGEGK